MSDVFEGPGWWMASDGKWYPPKDHPDEGYRNRFSTPAPVVAGPPAAEVAHQRVPTTVEVPTTADVVEPAAVTVQDEPALNRSMPTPLIGVNGFNGHHAQLANDVPAPTNDVIADEQAPLEAQPDLSATPDRANDASVSVSDDQWATYDEPTPEVNRAIDSPVARPEPDQIRISKPEPLTPSPKSTVERVRSQRRLPPSVTTSLDGHPDVEIELGRPAPAPRTGVGQGLGEIGFQPVRATTTDIVPVPTPVEPQVPVRDRMSAVLIFLSGIAMIVGSFLAWVTGEVNASGWERGEGIVTVIVGIAGSAAAGPIFVGFRHTVLKATAIIGGLVGLVVLGLTAISVFSDSAESAPGVGIGLIVVGAAAAAMLLAGITQPNSNDW